MDFFIVSPDVVGGGRPVFCLDHERVNQMLWRDSLGTIMFIDVQWICRRLTTVFPEVF